MANETDSFIDEVTEDLRRDRLFQAMRRYGWIAIAIILVIVGAVGYREWQQNRLTHEARAFGDALLAAERAEDPVAATAALADSLTEPADLARLYAARVAVDAGQVDLAVAQLSAVDADGSDPLLGDLARLKRVMIESETMDLAERDAILAALSVPGAPFELLALEQKAIALIGAGRDEDATTLLVQLQQKAGVSEEMRRRIEEMLTALGHQPPEGE